MSRTRSDSLSLLANARIAESLERISRVEDLLELGDGFVELGLEGGEEGEDVFCGGGNGIGRGLGLGGKECGEGAPECGEPLGVVRGDLEEFGGEGRHSDEDGLGSLEGWEEGEEGQGGGGSLEIWVELSFKVTKISGSAHMLISLNEDHEVVTLSDRQISNKAMYGSGGVSNGYEIGSKRPRMMDSNPYFAVSSSTAAYHHHHHHAYDYTAATFHPSTFPVVRLRGLPFNCTDTDIFKFFSGLEILDVLLVNKSGRFSGEAFVVFTRPMQAELALQKDHQNMGRRYVEVFKCKKQDYYNAVAGEVRYDHNNNNNNNSNSNSNNSNNNNDYYYCYNGGSPPRSKRFQDKDQMEYTEILKLRGLPFSVVEGKVFIACRPDGKATGEAYVEFETVEEAKEAMVKDKKMIGSRYVELFPSTPDEARRAESRSRQLLNYCKKGQNDSLTMVT
ncbi:hypothetical protein LXL04_013895 [Taraxacum kok-saghyz]